MGVFLRGLHPRRTLVEHHRQFPHGGSRSQVGAAIEQQFHDLGVTLRHGPHQRRLLAFAFRGVHVGVLRQQRAHRGSAASPCRAHQRRDTGFRRGIRIRAQLEQPLDDGGVGVVGGNRQRRDRQIVGGVGFGTAADQEAEDFDVAVVRGPMERRGAVAFGGIDVGTLFQERPHRRHIIAFRRLHERLITSGGGDHAREQQQRQYANRC